jgi:hypothetical protein
MRTKSNQIAQKWMVNAGMNALKLTRPALSFEVRRQNKKFNTACT